MKIRGTTAGRDVLKEDRQGNVLRTDDVKQLDKNPKKIVRLKSLDQIAVLKLYHEYKAEQDGQKVASFSTL